MLCRELQAPGPPAADRIDLVCEMLILASIIQAPPVQLSREERTVRALEAKMRADFLADYDIGKLAAASGVHPATLRRYWDRAFSFPPARYAMKLRMNESCRMLVETRLTVSEISYTLKFEDPLYFSRKFKKTFGCTATEYRRRHRMPG
jgi:AraC family transcriptional regulator of arabinose operon